MWGQPPSAVDRAKARQFQSRKPALGCAGSPHGAPCPCTSITAMVPSIIVPLKKGISVRAVLGHRLSPAGVAQLVEHLICNQRVRGSNPFASSRKWFGNAGHLRGAAARQIFQQHSIRMLFQVWCSERTSMFVRNYRSSVLGQGTLPSMILGADAQIPATLAGCCRQEPKGSAFLHRWVSG
jgi:hypothetical protein